MGANCEATMDECDTWRLGQEDLLLHLCLHLLHKGEQSPLLWYYELDRLIRQQRSLLDWNVFVHQAQTMGQASLIADVLATLIHHFHSTIPDSIMSRLLHPSRPSPADARSYAGSIVTERARGICTSMLVTRPSTKNPVRLCAPLSICPIHGPALWAIQSHRSYQLIHRPGPPPHLGRM